jgi:hypothetical protein
VVISVSFLFGWIVVRPALDGNTPSGATASQPACEANAASFDAYPLVNLGPEFEGLPLVGCERITGAGTDYGIPPTDFFAFYYGVCGDPSSADEPCPVPLQVTVDPPCAPVPDDAVVEARTSLRDAPALMLRDGAIVVDGGAFTVTVSASDDAGGLVERAVGQLRAANSLAGDLRQDDALLLSASAGPACE